MWPVTVGLWTAQHLQKETSPVVCWILEMCEYCFFPKEQVETPTADSRWHCGEPGRSVGAVCGPLACAGRCPSPSVGWSQRWSERPKRPGWWASSGRHMMTSSTKHLRMARRRKLKNKEEFREKKRKSRKETERKADTETSSGQKPLKYLVGFSELLDPANTATQTATGFTAIWRARHMFLKLAWQTFPELDMLQEVKQVWIMKLTMADDASVIVLCRCLCILHCIVSIQTCPQKHSKISFCLSVLYVNKSLHRASKTVAL